jgi:hypothetical protein
MSYATNGVWYGQSSYMSFLLFQAQLWTQKSATLQSLISIFAAMQGFRLCLHPSLKTYSFFHTIILFRSLAFGSCFSLSVQLDVIVYLFVLETSFTLV